MDADQKKSLETLLREMLKAGKKPDKAAKPGQPRKTMGNVIRRRKGNVDKRFFSK